MLIACVEILQLPQSSIEVYRRSNLVLQPARNLPLVVAKAIAQVKQKDRTEIFHMPDYTADCLIHRTMSLLRIPVLPWNIDDLLPVQSSDTSSLLISLVVKVILLEDDLRITYARVRHSNYDHQSSLAVFKVESFTESTSTDAHQNGTILSLFWLIDAFVKRINSVLKGR